MARFEVFMEGIERNFVVLADNSDETPKAAMNRLKKDAGGVDTRHRPIALNPDRIIAVRRLRT